MIVVLGDAMVDRYWFGDVVRVSPEAPVPVLSVKRVEERDGAARNVVRNVLAMGGECRGVYGRSLEGEVLKIRAIGRSQQMLRVDFDLPVEPIGLDADVGEGGGIVIFSDYGKGALANVRGLILRAKIRGQVVLVDPKGYDWERYRYADVVKPNLDEMRSAIGGWKDERELESKAKALRERLDLGAILLTRAAEGMTLFDASGVTSIASQAREVYDVTGAGDTAIAALAVALARGCDLAQAARYANKAAGVVVGRFGTALATEDEVFS